MAEPIPRTRLQKFSARFKVSRYFVFSRFALSRKRPRAWIIVVVVVVIVVEEEEEVLRSLRRGDSKVGDKPKEWEVSNMANLILPRGNC